MRSNKTIYNVLMLGPQASGKTRFGEIAQTNSPPEHYVHTFGKTLYQANFNEQELKLNLREGHASNADINQTHNPDAPYKNTTERTHLIIAFFRDHTGFESVTTELEKIVPEDYQGRVLLFYNHTENKYDMQLQSEVQNFARSKGYEFDARNLKTLKKEDIPHLITNNAAKPASQFEAAEQSETAELFEKLIEPQSACSTFKLFTGTAVMGALTGALWFAIVTGAVSALIASLPGVLPCLLFGTTVVVATSLSAASLTLLFKTGATLWNCCKGNKPSEPGDTTVKTETKVNVTKDGNSLAVS